MAGSGSVLVCFGRVLGGFLDHKKYIKQIINIEFSLCFWKILMGSRFSGTWNLIGIVPIQIGLVGPDEIHGSSLPGLPISKARPLGHSAGNSLPLGIGLFGSFAASL